MSYLTPNDAYNSLEATPYTANTGTNGMYNIIRLIIVNAISTIDNSVLVFLVQNQQ